SKETRVGDDEQSPDASYSKEGSDAGCVHSDRTEAIRPVRVKGLGDSLRPAQSTVKEHKGGDAADQHPECHVNVHEHQGDPRKPVIDWIEVPPMVREFPIQETVTRVNGQALPCYHDCDGDRHDGQHIPAPSVECTYLVSDEGSHALADQAIGAEDTITNEIQKQLGRRRCLNCVV